LQAVYRLYNPLTNAFIPSFIPDQKQKMALYAMHFGWVTLFSCFWLLFEVPGDGQQAGSKNFSEIVYDIFDVPFFNPFNPATLPQLLVVVYGSIADMVARYLTSWFHKRYFIRKPVHLGDLKTRRLRVELIKMWHDRGTKCFWRAIGFTFVAFAASIALSTRVSHRRAAVVVHSILWAFLFANVVYTLLAVLVIGGMLILATKKNHADGFISYFPAMMDFELIDVPNPKFLAWRYMQIEKESVVLAQIYDPKRDLTVDEENAKRENEAGN